MQDGLINYEEFSETFNIPSFDHTIEDADMAESKENQDQLKAMAGVRQVPSSKWECPGCTFNRLFIGGCL